MASIRVIDGCDECPAIILQSLHKLTENFFDQYEACLYFVLFSELQSYLVLMFEVVRSGRKSVGDLLVIGQQNNFGAH